MQKLPRTICGEFFLCFHYAGILEKMLYEPCELQPCSTASELFCRPCPQLLPCVPVQHLLSGAALPGTALPRAHPAALLQRALKVPLLTGKPSFCNTAMPPVPPELSSLRHHRSSSPPSSRCLLGRVPRLPLGCC